MAQGSKKIHPKPYTGTGGLKFLLITQHDGKRSHAVIDECWQDLTCGPSWVDPESRAVAMGAISCYYDWPDSKLLLVFHEQEFVGVASFTPPYNGHMMVGCLSAKRPGEGVGKAMLRELAIIASGKRAGVVLEATDSSQGFYEHMGMQQLHTDKSIYEFTVEQTADIALEEIGRA